MEPQRRRLSPLWRHRDFLVFWGGQSFSQIGSRISREGLPLAAVLTLGASPMMMGWMQVISALPVIFLGLVVGVFMDRFPRKPFLIFTDVTRFAFLLIIPLAAVTGWLHMWVLFLAAAVMSALDLVFTAAYESYLPGFVGRPLLVDANTKLSITESFAEIVGPGLAGVLVQLITAPMAVLLDSFSYLVSAVSIWSIGADEPSHAGRQASIHLRRDIRDGFRTIIHSPVLLSLTAASATSAIFSGIVFTMDVLFAIRTLHLGPALFGLTVTFGGVGAILGASLTQRLIRRFGFGTLLVTSAFLDGLCGWFIPLAHGPVWMATLYLIAAQLLGDLFGVMSGILMSSLRQAVTGDAVLGRVNSTVNLLSSTLSPAGSLLGAWIATVVNLRIAMAVGVAGITVSALWLVNPWILRVTDLPREDTQST